MVLCAAGICISGMEGFTRLEKLVLLGLDLLPGIQIQLQLLRIVSVLLRLGSTLQLVHMTDGMVAPSAAWKVET